MRKALAAVALYLGLATAALAQNFTMPPPAGVTVGGFAIVASCGSQSLSATQGFGTMDQTGKFCVNASVSASVTGFPTIQTTGTPIAVTTSGVTGSLPSGTVVVASNVGATNGAYCKLGASATTSDQLIPPNSWFAFTVGSNTQLTCITSSSTTTVNMVGGSGLPTGSGGGGSSSGGGGGAVTLASGAVASGAYSSGSIASGAYASGSLAAGAGTDGWDVTQGTKNDGPCASGSTTPCSTEARLAHIENLIAGPIAAGSAIIGKVGIDQTTPGTTNGVTPTDGTNTALVDPCQSGAKTYTPVNVVTATNIIIAGVASKKKYVCGMFLYPAGTDNIAIYQATTGTSCATAAVGVIGGATTATGIIATAQAGFVLPTTGYAHAATTVNQTDLCITTSAAVQLSGVVVTVDR